MPDVGLIYRRCYVLKCLLTAILQKFAKVGTNFVLGNHLIDGPSITSASQSIKYFPQFSIHMGTMSCHLPSKGLAYKFVTM